MKNLDEIALKHGTDKSSLAHYYTKYYQNNFTKYENKDIKLLEIGIQKGYSLLMWQEYFEKAKIYGIDTTLPDNISRDRITMLQGRQEDENFIKILNTIYGPFDIIIDDGSHHNDHMRKSFDVLFPLLALGGCYIIEDLHCCYWDKTHNTGSVKFTDYLKNLIEDTIGRGKSGISNRSKSKKDNTYLNKIYGEYTLYEELIESIHVYRGICFIFKSDEIIL